MEIQPPVDPGHYVHDAVHGDRAVGHDHAMLPGGQRREHERRHTA
jgi:hypothetical protein